MFTLINFGHSCIIKMCMTLILRWKAAECQTEPLSIVQLPDNEYFNGGTLELLDVDLFGPALYWR